MMNQESSFLIQLTEDQVRQAMNSLVDDIQTQWPDERQAENVACFLSREFERNLLRYYVAPRVPDCREVAWLEGNKVRWIIKSSVEQFTRKHVLRIHVCEQAQRQRFKGWLNG